jgi:hypothetical protein
LLLFVRQRRDYLVTPEERAELTRDVAHVVAEALSPAMNTMARGRGLLIHPVFYAKMDGLWP